MNAQLALVPTPDSNHALHARLARFNARRLRPGYASAQWESHLREELAMRIEEGRFLEAERASVAPGLNEVPTDADGFMQWFESLTHTGPGQNDALFPWLAERATMEQMRWFLTQEIAGEAGFDDLVALTQVRFPMQPKLEMARNYWDEMGRGHEKGMHGGMLENTAQQLGLHATIETTVAESLALANVMAGLAANRRYAYQSVGALGAIEMTAPGRVSLVNEGLKRLGVDALGRQYFQLHAGLDVRHSEAWNREVMRPLVAADARNALPLAQGALLRLQCGARCFARYRSELGVV